MLTAVVLAKNEADNLPVCLTSLAFCDQVVVINDNSSDSTASIAKKFGAMVINHPLETSFSDLRNWALDYIKSPWLLFVDADEQVSPLLASAIRQAIDLPGSTKGFYMHRTDILWGRHLLYGDTGSVWILRLARRGSGLWLGDVHETWHISGPTARLSGPLIHRPHHNLYGFLSHLNSYSTRRAAELFRSKSPSNLLLIILYPPGKFLFLWLVKMGFRDGTVGFIHAMSMAFYSFLVRGKLYMLYKGIPHG